MNTTSSTGKKHGNESDGDRESKKPRLRDSNPASVPGAHRKKYEALDPHTVHRPVDKILPGQVMEACPALKARYHSDLTYVFEYGHISQPQIAAMYDQWFEVSFPPLVVN